jgi:hypothetical protein
MNMLLPVSAILLLASAVLAQPSSHPAVAPPKDGNAMGLGIQRTMTLLATSTPRHRNKVRILFYGQSITEQEWSKLVADDLRKRFPNADLDIQNRAIGGFAAQMLIRPAEHDLYPFYPDLLIFHVYGANQQYEQIIQSVRSRTTAEVLMQLDHVTKWPTPPFDPNGDKGMWWDNLMNTRLLPEIARKYGCGLVDIRNGWLDYLKANRLEPKDLLKDGVHLNAHGNYVMAELIKQYLVYRPDLPGDSWKDLVRTYEIGKDVQWKDGKLRLEFEGNRVDVLAGEADGKSAQVLIDGKKPSEFPGCYYVPRPTPGPWSPLALVRVDREKPWVLEDWSLKITSVNADSTQWQFQVAGSVTGPDGHGSNAAVFTSNSGRVKIDPQAFFRNGKVSVGYEIKWKVLPMFVDAYRSPATTGATEDNAVAVAQGLDNGKHLLELTSSGGVPAIRAIRVYRPAMAGK